jgi:hypothetical protein
MGIGYCRFARQCYITVESDARKEHTRYYVSVTSRRGNRLSASRAGRRHHRHCVLPSHKRSRGTGSELGSNGKPGTASAIGATGTVTGGSGGTPPASGTAVSSDSGTLGGAAANCWTMSRHGTPGLSAGPAAAVALSTKTGPNQPRGRHSRDRQAIRGG